MSVIRLECLFPSGVTQTVTVTEILKVNGEKFNGFNTDQTLPQEDLTEVVRRVTLLEAGLGFVLDRMGTDQMFVEGPEPPAIPPETPNTEKKNG